MTPASPATLTLPTHDLVSRPVALSSNAALSVRAKALRLKVLLDIASLKISKRSLQSRCDRRSSGDRLGQLQSPVEEHLAEDDRSDAGASAARSGWPSGPPLRRRRSPHPRLRRADRAAPGPGSRLRGRGRTAARRPLPAQRRGRAGAAVADDATGTRRGAPPARRARSRASRRPLAATRPARRDPRRPTRAA